MGQLKTLSFVALVSVLVNRVGGLLDHIRAMSSVIVEDIKQIEVVFVENGANAEGGSNFRYVESEKAVDGRLNVGAFAAPRD